MTKNQKLREHCSRCTKNFYNGNNSLGVDECWHLAHSQVVFKYRVPRSQHIPNHFQQPVPVLDCQVEEHNILVEETSERYKPSTLRIRAR